MNSPLCPSCLNSSFEPLIDFGRIPRTGYFLSSPSQSYPTLQLDFEFCSQCGLIRRCTEDEETPDYTEVNRKTDRQLPNYAQEIINRLHQKNISKDELVIEIGANDGTFLNLLAETGFKRRLAVEPSTTLATICHENGHQVCNTHLDKKQALNIREKWGLASLIICRHTLEHVPKPRELLLAMRALLAEGGILFLEVPDTRIILEELQGYELWDEHLHYFTVDNLSILLKQTGFSLDVIKSLSHRSSANILCWCSLDAQLNNHDTYEVSERLSNLERCHNFSKEWTTLSQQLLTAITSGKEPIIAIGAGHLQSNFLQFTGLGSYISFLVDDDTLKSGKYLLLPQKVPVISTAELLSKVSPGTIVKTAFGYDSWMNKIIDAYSSSELTIIDPYSFLKESGSTRHESN